MTGTIFIVLGEWTCEWKFTNFDSDGGNNGSKQAIHLARHAPDCGSGKVINSFQLETNNLYQYRYRYQCCTAQLPCTNTNKENDFTDDGAPEGDPIYLDRQNVNCEDQPITYFHLVRKDSGDEWKYKYRCCNSQFTQQCVDKQTNFDTDGDRQTIYLDRHNVACPQYYGISRFQLNRNSGGDKYRYLYRCCKAIQL